MIMNIFSNYISWHKHYPLQVSGLELCDIVFTYLLGHITTKILLNTKFHYHTTSTLCSEIRDWHLLIMKIILKFLVLNV